MTVDPAEAQRRLVRDIRGSGRPESDIVPPANWPVLQGSLCHLRVLVEEDAPLWRGAEDDWQFVADPNKEFYGPGRDVSIEMEIRRRRVAWALGGGLRHWGIWTTPGADLAGGVALRPAGLGGSVPLTAVTWVVWQQFYSVDFAAEVLRLAASWALENLPPADVVVLLPETASVDEQVLAAAGFAFDGPPNPWEAGRIRFRFQGPRV